MLSKKQILALIPMIYLLSSCAYLHHVHIGEVDSVLLKKSQRFEVMVSETGINIDEATSVAKALSGNKKTREALDSVRDTIALFQMGPRTGNPVYNEHYNKKLAEMVLAKCPDGKINNLMSIRESNKYPVVSGEIVKIIGYCYRKNAAQSETKSQSHLASQN